MLPVELWNLWNCENLFPYYSELVFTLNRLNKYSKKHLYVYQIYTLSSKLFIRCYSLVNVLLTSLTVNSIVRFGILIPLLHTTRHYSHLRALEISQLTYSNRNKSRISDGFRWNPVYVSSAKLNLNWKNSLIQTFRLLTAKKWSGSENIPTTFWLYWSNGIMELIN